MRRIYNIFIAHYVSILVSVCLSHACLWLENKNVSKAQNLWKLVLLHAQTEVIYPSAGMENIVIFSKISQISDVFDIFGMYPIFKFL